jgi:hypothetical protein
MSHLSNPFFIWRSLAFRVPNGTLYGPNQSGSPKYQNWNQKQKQITLCFYKTFFAQMFAMGLFLSQNGKPTRAIY